MTLLLHNVILLKKQVARQLETRHERDPSSASTRGRTVHKRIPKKLQTCSLVE